jgi:branched-chain amino acid transport system substrate-binding protein
MTRFRKTLALFGALLLGSTSLAISARAGEHDGQQLYPLLSYRTGPYASSGIPQWAGIRDYLTYVNDVQGGVDGVKVFVQNARRPTRSSADSNATSVTKTATTARRSRS